MKQVTLGCRSAWEPIRTSLSRAAVNQEAKDVTSQRVVVEDDGANTPSGAVAVYCVLSSVVGWLIFFVALGLGASFWTALFSGFSISLFGGVFGSIFTYLYATSAEGVKSSLSDDLLPEESLDVLLVASERFGAIHIHELFNEIGHRVYVLDDLDTALNVIANGSFDWSVLAVDLDCAGALEDIVEQLISFREENPQTCVLALTGCTLSDDLSGHRRPICDATVKIPATPSRLRDALAAALENHGFR